MPGEADRPLGEPLAAEELRDRAAEEADQDVALAQDAVGDPDGDQERGAEPEEGRAHDAAPASSRASATSDRGADSRRLRRGGRAGEERDRLRDHLRVPEDAAVAQTLGHPQLRARPGRDQASPPRRRRLRVGAVGRRQRDGHLRRPLERLELGVGDADPALDRRGRGAARASLAEAEHRREAGACSRAGRRPGATKTTRSAGSPRASAQVAPTAPAEWATTAEIGCQRAAAASSAAPRRPATSCGRAPRRAPARRRRPPGSRPGAAARRTPRAARPGPPSRGGGRRWAPARPAGSGPAPDPGDRLGRARSRRSKRSAPWSTACSRAGTGWRRVRRKSGAGERRPASAGDRAVERRGRPPGGQRGIIVRSFVFFVEAM